MLTTGGNLVFAGGTSDRKFRAFDATTGERAVGVHDQLAASPACLQSFVVDGVQYIAVQSGWGVDAERMQGALAEHAARTRTAHVPQGGVIWVFALKDQA